LLATLFPIDAAEATAGQIAFNAILRNTMSVHLWEGGLAKGGLVVAIPEPGEVAFLLAGLAFSAARIRRRAARSR
jgi:hypothetical protein